MNDRYKKMLDELFLDMKNRKIQQKEILQHYEGMSSATLINFLKGRSVSMDIMDKVISYIDDPKNWDKPKKKYAKKEKTESE
ncbi:MAG: hypothetical protein ACRCX2_09110 [Paraclostridium sp.]